VSKQGATRAKEWQLDHGDKSGTNVESARWIRANS